ncbi:MAG: PEP-CTERM sorting domain-containing protein [Planctomycetes bacterium]|nr:PEP-CTERM sorting domain-containing protein [Planctomycetota bacterium]
MRSKWFLPAFLAAVLAPSAGGMIIDSSGNIIDWGITPFSQPNGSDIHSGSLWATIQNNYAPISYPGVGREPSPGVTRGGEQYDLEELYLRIQDHQVQLLVITSSAWSTQAWGNTVYLGDMFLTIDGQEFGIVTQQANAGLAQGAIYRLDSSGDTKGIQQQAGSYYNSTTLVANDYGPSATIPDIIGPWAVSGSIDPDQLLGTASMSWATYNYGGAENGTFILEYAFSGDLLGLLNPGDLTAQISWGCGNDVIRTDGPTVPVVPEPATVLLVAAGGTFVYLTSRRQRPIRGHWN